MTGSRGGMERPGIPGESGTSPAPLAVARTRLGQADAMAALAPGALAAQLRARSRLVVALLGYNAHADATTCIGGMPRWCDTTLCECAGYRRQPHTWTAQAAQ